jgi:uncharacterized protein YbjT (DUF2867 family)
MRIVVVGGSGLIGDKVMTALHDAGHQAVAASPAFGIDAFTGEGLDEAMAGADVVVDVSNAPDWKDEKVLEFFTTVTRNALKAGRRAGARHHVALSVLGCDRLPESGYMRAKVAQEELIRGAKVPFTIVHSTQFMEFMARVADAGAEGDVVRVPDAHVQPIAAVEVAGFVAAVATEPPANGVVEIAGPDAFGFEDAIARVLAARSDRRRVVADTEARYFGTAVRGDVLLPGPQARITTLRLADWLSGRASHGVGYKERPHEDRGRRWQRAPREQGRPAVGRGRA